MFGYLSIIASHNMSIMSIQALKCEYKKVAGAGTSCDHEKCKLRAVAVAEGFWVAELRVWQVKIGHKSCFDIYIYFSLN